MSLEKVMCEFEATISEDEYVRAQKLYGRLSAKIKVIYFLVAAGLIWIGIAGDSSTRYTAISALVGGIIGHLMVTGFLAPRRSRKNYKNYPLIQRPFLIRPESTGVFFKSENGETILKWESIHKWRENKEFILIYPAPNLFHVIPKRLSNSGLDIESLASSLGKNIGSAT